MTRASDETCTSHQAQTVEVSAPGARWLEMAPPFTVPALGGGKTATFTSGWVFMARGRCVPSFGSHSGRACRSRSSP